MRTAGKRKEGRGKRGLPGIRSAAVLGLGLIGGSLARELAARGVRVLGFDRDPAALRSALEEGVVHAALDASLDGAEEAEVVVIAVPVSATRATLESAVSHLRNARLVTDVGSTKRAVVRAAEALGIGERFVGAHPLAGDHRSGWRASRVGLFEGARVYLCPTASTDEAALGLARRLWTALGAEPELLDAEAHDRRLAWISHLPQAASTALALALDTVGMRRSDLGPGGRELTRLAGSAPEMWTGIALENAEFLTEAISALEARLRELRAALSGADEVAIHRIYAAGQRWSRAGDSSD